MTAPKRIQRRRTKGWQMPEGAIYVGRPSGWGNPYRALPTADGWSVFRRISTPAGHLDVWIERVGIVTRAQAIAESVRLYRLHVESWVEDEFDGDLHSALDELRDHDLVCWCPLDQQCHADVLIELANRELS